MSREDNKIMLRFLNELELHIQQEDWTWIRDLLSHRDDFRDFVLTRSGYLGKKELLRHLFLAGFNPYPALRGMVQAGNETLIDNFIRSGLSISWMSGVAAEQDFRHLVFKLIKSGDHPRYALFGAIRGHHIMLVIEVLLEYRNQLSEQDLVDALEEAVLYRDVSAVRFLINKFHPTPSEKILYLMTNVPHIAEIFSGPNGDLFRMLEQQWNQNQFKQHTKGNEKKRSRESEEGGNNSKQLRLLDPSARQRR